MIRENYHTHTVYCDGVNTPAELAEKAVELGLDYLGFSGHGHTAVDRSYCMSPENTVKYVNDVNSLKGKYPGLTVLCGIEQDIVSTDDVNSFDYVIGSTHYITKNNRCYSIDESVEKFNAIYEQLFDKNIGLFAKEYFLNASTVCDNFKCDIIGHFDLISKFFEKLSVCETEEYLMYAENAVKKLIKFNVPFEINTGAMARGYRTEPYPSKNILKMINDNGGKIIFSSDCHMADYLLCGFNEAEKLAKQVGFNKRSIITAQGEQQLPL